MAQVVNTETACPAEATLSAMSRQGSSDPPITSGPYRWTTKAIFMMFNLRLCLSQPTDHLEEEWFPAFGLKLHQPSPLPADDILSEVLIAGDDIQELCAPLRPLIPDQDPGPVESIGDGSGI